MSDGITEARRGTFFLDRSVKEKKEKEKDKEEESDESEDITKR